MQRVRFSLFAMLAVALTGAGISPLAPGEPAPHFLLERSGGDPYTLATFAGKPLVMNVFASWCPPCRSELPRIVAAARATSGRVAFLGVDEQEPLTMGEAFARQMKIPYPIAFDHGQFAASYGAQSLPVTVFVDRTGHIAAIVRGAMSDRDLSTNLAKIDRIIATPGRT